MVNKLYESAKKAHPEIYTRPKISTYTFRPAGCKPPPKQRDCTQLDNALEKAFEKYMKFVEECNKESVEECDKKFVEELSKLDLHKAYHEILYNKAYGLIKDIRSNPNEIHALLLAYQDNPNIEYAGLFVSAVYNRSTDHEIIYDLDIPVDFLGYKLPKDKTFINRGTAGGLMGSYAKGPVINYGTAGWCMGECAEGPAINYGTAGETMGWNAKGPVINHSTTGSQMGWNAKGPVINYGTADWWMGGYAEGLVINYGTASKFMGEYAKGLIIALKNPESFGNVSKANRVLKKNKCKQMPELIEYFDNLKNIIDAGKQDYRALNTIPSAEQMEADIRKILKKAGKL